MSSRNINYYFSCEIASCYISLPGRIGHVGCMTVDPAAPDQPEIAALCEIYTYSYP